MKEYDLIIAGGCASGLAAVIQAKREYPGIKIALLEKLPRVGKKLLSTGNGRCNFTNLSITPQDYYGNSFVSAVLGKYPPEKIIDFFKSLGLESYSDTAGRVYPRSNTAASLLDSLRLEVDESDTDVFTDCEVKSVYHSDKGFIVNDEFKSAKLIISTGGKSSPAQGSDGSGYKLAEMLGHSITGLFPSLVPLTCGSATVKSMKGIRANNAYLTVTDGKSSLSSQGEVLFTENGVSGIAAMELASFTEKVRANGKNPVLTIDFLPDYSREKLYEYITLTAEKYPDRAVDYLLTGVLPKPISAALLKDAGIYSGNCKFSDVDSSAAEKILNSVKSYSILLTGTKGYNFSQVTCGGVDTRGVNESTMESRLVDGLYFCGEILDVDGRCGGYNLHWAFASGLTAGELK